MLRGAALIDRFKNIGLIILGIFIALKITGTLWLLGFCMIGALILMVIGWLDVYHVAKVLDWLNIQLGTHWSRYNYELMEKQIKLLEEILDEFKNRK